MEGLTHELRQIQRIDLLYPPLGVEGTAAGGDRHVEADADASGPGVRTGTGETARDRRWVIQKKAAA